MKSMQSNTIRRKMHWSECTSPALFRDLRPLRVVLHRCPTPLRALAPSPVYCAEHSTLTNAVSRKIDELAHGSLASMTACTSLSLYLALSQRYAAA